MYSFKTPSRWASNPPERIRATSIPAAIISAAMFLVTALAPSCREHTRPPSPFDIQVYAVSNRGFGFALYQGAARIIDQPNIPAIRGLVPFRSRGEAERIAQLMSHKLQSHQFPPTVTLHELDSLQIRH